VGEQIKYVKEGKLVAVVVSPTGKKPSLAAGKNTAKMRRKEPARQEKCWHENTGYLGRSRANSAKEKTT
jgi:hypothetical protein